MPPVVHDQTGTLNEDAVAAWMFADKVGHQSAQAWLYHLDLLIGAWRHCFQARVSLARCLRVNFRALLGRHEMIHCYVARFYLIICLIGGVLIYFSKFMAVYSDFSLLSLLL